MNGAEDLLRGSLTAVRQAVLDSCDDGKKKDTDKVAAVMDAAGYASQNVRAMAAAAVQQWCESGQEMDEGEGPADRLTMLLVGIADGDKDGELTDDEQSVFGLAGEAAWDYMAGKGVSDDDLEAIFNSDDPEVSNAAAVRACDLLCGVLPSGDDDSADDIDGFAFGSDALQPALDAVAVFDAVYKNTFAVRGGKKVRIKKRIAGTVRLTAKQKVAVRKMQHKSHSAAAMIRRLKSARIGQRMGLNGR